jgi:hypothetical protein
MTSQTEIEPNNAKTTEEKPSEPAGARQEKKGDAETTQNSEKIVEYWNKHSANEENIELIIWC